MASPRVVILGGGPAGVGAARELARRKLGSATLLEAGAHYGGNAGSFEFGGQWLDYGSHRLHPATDPAILADIRALLGADLKDRPRHGRIRLLGKWIHFPLKPVDLLLRLDKSFAIGTLRDMVAKKLPGRAPEGDTFESVIRANLGHTIADEFYLPYAVKLWGRDPKELSGVQARKRVAAGSFGKLVRKVMNAVPGFKAPGAGRFYYPVRGFGQISEAYAAEAAKLGADMRLGWRMTKLERPAGESAPWRVHAEGHGRADVLEADYVWSTIPVTLLARALAPAAPADVLEATKAVTYRSMILIYVQLPVEQFTEYDAHYFPGAKTRITRLSEPKNYSDLGRPKGSTILCAELPCAMGDAVWKMGDEELGRLLAEDLAECGLPLPAKPTTVFTRRLPQAYPIYLMGYEAPLAKVEGWVESVPRLLSYGRQGLFQHDNTHHALAMAYGAVDCMQSGRFDTKHWGELRQVFAKHVVED
ncbi:MAG: FAD-dependent oxidoreductase [Planctomycetaceae bacterium]|nr:FAD-dependent oxidoreductase [Planctomycetaceae bacterium]